MKTIDKLIKEAHENAVKHGFYVERQTAPAVAYRLELQVGRTAGKLRGVEETLRRSS